MVIKYFLRTPASGDVVVKVLQGFRVVSETKGSNAAGLNQVMWNMRITETVLVQPAQGAGRGRGGEGGGAGFGGGRGGAAPAVPAFGGSIAASPGDYTIVVSAGNKTLIKKIRILEDAWFDKVF